MVGMEHYDDVGAELERLQITGLLISAISSVLDVNHNGQTDGARNPGKYSSVVGCTLRLGANLQGVSTSMSTRAHSSSTPASLWWALASFLGLAKLTVFVFDSNPQVLLGDSMSYLSTAMQGWIPPDRSFLYGFLVHNVTTRARSLS